MASKKNKKVENIVSEEKNAGVFPWFVFLFVSFFILKEFFYKFPLDLNSLFSAISPAQYLSAVKFKPLFSNLFNLSVGIYASISILGFGMLFLKAFKSDLKGLSFLIVSYCLGLVFIIVLSAGLGLFHLVKKEYFLFFSIIGFLFFVFDVYKQKECFKQLSLKSFSEFPFYYLFFLLIILINLIQTLSPETFYDTVIYHLAVPNYWKIEGKISDMPYSIFSKMPFNHGLVYLYALEIGNVITAKTVNFFISVATLLSFFAFFKNRFSQNVLFAAAALFFSLFHYMNVSWYASNDAMLTFFLVCSFYLFFKFVEENNFLNLAISGIFAGAAMGIKYTALIFVVAMLAAGAFQMRKDFKKIFFSFSIFTIFASLFLSGWLIKNYLAYSNPFYPMLNSIFNRNLSDFDLRLIASFTSEVKQYTFTFATWLKHPFDISTGKIANSEYFTPLFAMILPLGFFNKSKNDFLKPLWIYFLFSWLAWSFSSNVIRYLMPAYFAACLIAAFLVEESFKGYFKKALKFSFLFLVFVSFYWALLFFYMEGKWKVFLGQAEEKQYLASSQPRYPWPSYGTINYINEKLTPAHKVLFLGESKTLYMQKRFEASSVFDRNMLIELSASSKNYQDLYFRLKERGITHILFNIKEAMRNNMAYRIFYFDEKSIKNFNDFFEKHLEEVYFYDETHNSSVANRTILYEIKEKTSKSKVNYIFDVYEKGRKI